MAVINARNSIITADGEVKTLNHDLTTAPIILPFAQVVATTTTAAEAVKGAYTIEVASTASMVVGQHFRIVDPISNRFYAGQIVSIASPNVTLDNQFDFEYLSGSEVTVSNTDMSVNGAVTPVLFKSRTGTISIPSRVDLTRILFTCITDTPVTLPAFGDLTALTRGLALRINRNDTQNNILNIKTNQGIINMAYDFNVFQATNPAQGVDGFSSRLTFAGQEKVGVALRIEQDENVEVLIQDDLTGLTSLQIFFEGHIVPQ